MPNEMPYDTDVDKFQKIAMWAKEQQYRAGTDLESFRKEIIDKFRHIGYEANVLCYETNQADVYAFDFEVVGRLDPNHEFDFDQMKHEVVNNVLDIPGVEKGHTIKADAELARMERERKLSGSKHKH